MIRRAVLACLLGLAAAAPPPERPLPERPPPVPAKDAVLGYHLAPGTGEAIDVRVVMAAGGKGMRVDLPDTSYMLAVPATRSLTMVVPLERTIADLPWSDGPQSLFLLDDRMRFNRRGEATVAGQRCTQWDATLDQERHTLCVTADGLVLRNQFQDPLGRRNLVEAFAVRYVAIPEADLALPKDFERLVPDVLPKP